MTDKALDHHEVRARLLELLKERSFEQREVVLASGRKSNFYVDCRETSLHPEGAYLVGKAFLHAILEGPEIDAVAGVTVGGDPLVTSVAVVSHLEGRPIPAVIVRKQAKGHGKGGLLVGASRIPEGARVALLEDVVTTGGSVLKAMDALEEAGLAVVRVLCLVDRLEGGAENIMARGVELEPLFTRNDFPLEGA